MNCLSRSRSVLVKGCHLIKVKNVLQSHLKIQSTARSTLLSVSLSALTHFFVGMPMASSIARPSALGTKPDAAAAAPAEGLLENCDGFYNQVINIKVSGQFVSSLHD